MTGDLINRLSSEDIREILANRIEVIERVLIDDEEFCSREIDSTYDAAKIFFNNIQKQIDSRLNQLKTKLDFIRQENVRLCNKNQRQFDNELEKINDLFSSGKHNEALDKFSIYEKNFEQRNTLIKSIPKIYMKDLDLNQYFSIDKPLIQIKDQPLKHNSQSCSDIQSNHFDTQISNKPSDSPPISRPISMRLNSSISTQSLPILEQDLPNNSTISRQKSIREHSSQSTSIKSDVLVPKKIVPYQYEKNCSIYLTCNQNSILVFRREMDNFNSCHSLLINRSNKSIQDSKPHRIYVKSIGFLNDSTIYLFTDHEFLRYSSDFHQKLNSYILSNEHNYRSISEYIHSDCGGIIYDNYIYHMYVNSDKHLILSVLDFQTIKCINEENLTKLFPHVKQFQHFCIYEKFIYFLVRLESDYYAVLICLLENFRKIHYKNTIRLTYADKPLHICPIRISYLEKVILFINDPSTKIIHIISNDKYLKSTSMIAYEIYFHEQTCELLFVSNDGIYTININEQKNFFLKFQ